MVTVAKRVFIAGEFVAVPEEARETLHSFYERLADLCRQSGLGVYAPHFTSDPAKHPALSATQTHLLTEQRLTSSQLLIAYLGRPSCTVGGAVQLARHASIPVITLHESNLPLERIVSDYTLGSPNVIKRITGDTLKTILLSLCEDLPELLRLHVWKPSQP